MPARPTLTRQREGGARSQQESKWATIRQDQEESHRQPNRPKRRIWKWNEQCKMIGSISDQQGIAMAIFYLSNFIFDISLWIFIGNVRLGCCRPLEQLATFFMFQNRRSGPTFWAPARHINIQPEFLFSSSSSTKSLQDGHIQLITIIIYCWEARSNSWFQKCVLPLSHGCFYRKM